MKRITFGQMIILLILIMALVMYTGSGILASVSSTISLGVFLWWIAGFFISGPYLGSCQGRP